MTTVKTFENQMIADFHDRNSGKIFSDLEFRKCSFLSCAISMTLDPKLRTTVRNVKLINCEFISGFVSPAVIEEILVDGLKTNVLFQIWGAVLRHVTLKGKIGRIMFSPAVAPARATKEQQKAFDEANAAYYSKVDWALDIREAEFEECDIRSVPAHLVRRDPETQIVVTRAKALEGVWRDLDLSKTYWPVALNLLLEQGNQDTVLVAPIRNKRFHDLMYGLKLLRDMGIAEPD